MHDLLMAKLQAYGFDNDSLNFICNYLLVREQRIKINSSFSTWLKIEYGVPHTGAFTFQYKCIRHVL